MRNIHKALIAVGAAIVLSLAMAGPVLAETSPPTPAPTTTTTDPTTTPAPTETTPPTPPETYVIVAWTMPTKPTTPTTPTWPQTIFAHAGQATPDLGALDGQLTKCGTYYQVDIYIEDATTDALIAGGVLTSSNHPAESFPKPSGWNVTYKLVINADCPVVVTPPPTPTPTPPVVTPAPPTVTPTPQTLAETGTVPVGGFIFGGILFATGLALIVARILFDQRNKPRF